ncbi:MAG TPA: polyprenyl synthetase family protein [Fibrobacteria bacterium]|nr:polyprenyl synthetase family protein [Fibrobacteria bacterium]
MKDTLVRADYAAVLGEAREYVSAGLERVQAIMESVAQSAPGELSRNLQQLLTRRGKRVRSTFLLLLAQSGGQADAARMERTERVCAAIELIHLGSLIHDDIIDGSDLRRNEKTAHQRWGNRTAVLLGDYALSKAMELIWEDPDRRVPLSLCRASSALISAEALEVERAGRLDLTLEEYREVIAGKTAALFEACGECGALIAGFGPEDSKRAARLGRDFGLAFQIVDDLLDYGVGGDGLDKRPFSDLQNGLLTLPLILYLTDAAPDAKAHMLAMLSQPQLNGNQADIRSLLDASGAFVRARGMALDHVRAGLAFLETLPDTPAASHLRQVCLLMADRSL